jgi:hypothetical protein
MAGWLATATPTTGSIAVARANPPEKHIPITPTWPPPALAASRRASSMSQVVIGLVRRWASAVNCQDTQDWTSRTPASASAKPFVSAFVGLRRTPPSISGMTIRKPCARM